MVRRLKIGFRLYAGFGIILVLVFGIEWHVLSRMNEVSETTKDLYEHPFTVNNAVLECALFVREIDDRLGALVRSRNPAIVDGEERAVAELDSRIMTRLSVTTDRFLGEIGAVDATVEIAMQWRETRTTLFGLLRQGQQQRAERLYAEVSVPHADKAAVALDKMHAVSLQRAAGFAESAAGIVESTKNELRILAAVALLAGGLIAAIIAVSIVAPLARVMKTSEEVRSGNLGVELPTDRSNDEIGRLVRSFSSMVKALREQSKRMLEGVNLLASASGQISTTAVQLASSASETASAVNETTVTVEEVKKTAQISMERARDVAGSAQKTMAVAKGGEATVDATYGGMLRIREQMEQIAKSIMNLSEQTRTIGEIIASVDDIAEQSNLLAVNAAIEAAKAGEYGRGFGVVAREVRNLAEGSRQATRTVRTILGDVQKATGTAVMAMEQGSKAVEAGMERSTEVREALRRLSQGITESTQMAIQITSANQQQYEGVDQVTQAMESIKDASRQNVEAARQLEGAARNLDGLSRQLQESMGKYRL